jgi:hypothetical protein
LAKMPTSSSPPMQLGGRATSARSRRRLEMIAAAPDVL